MDVSESLSLQLTEVDMLSSMFPTPGEFELDTTADDDDTSAVSIIQDFVDGKIAYEFVQPRIGFVIKMETAETKSAVQLVAHFPHEYPGIAPEIFIRSGALSKDTHRILNNDLLHYIHNDVDRGELCMCFIVQWLQDNTEAYIKASKEPNKKLQKKDKTPKTDKQFSRLWIYSHHIYSKIKRKDILEFTSELDLSGFSMPGKPGIIVIEGYNSSVEEFWGRIRRMQWKRLVVKEKEQFEINDTNTVDSLRKFDGFEENFFEPRMNKGRASSCHGDRGLLFKFLEERGCGHVFQYYFGVEGKSVDHDSD